MAKRFNQLQQLTAAQLARTDQLAIRDESAGQVKYITVQDLTGAPDFSWQATAESWAFSSFNATTRIGIVTVPTDATTKYRKGNWVRFSQTTGGTKWGMVVAVTATTLSLNMFGYTLNNETITSPVYSSLASPVGAPALPYVWTEGNGWTVWDYGTERLIFYRQTFVGAVIGAGAFGTRGAGINMPVGFTTAQMGAGRSAGNDQALSHNFDHVTYTASVGFDVQNNYGGGGLTPTINWYLEVRAQV